MARFASGVSPLLRRQPVAFSFVGTYFLPALICLLLLLCETGLAQYNLGAGNPVMSSQSGGQFDSVNLASSNVAINIPVRQKNGKRPFWASLTGNYGAFIWTDANGKHWKVSSIVDGATSTFGLNVPALSTALVSTSTPTQCNGQPDVLYSQFAVVDASGTPHPLPSSIKIDQSTCYANSATAMTTDGSGYTVTLRFADLIQYIVYTIYDKAGNNTVSQ